MSALVLIKEVTANNANVVQVTDCFSATYSHYYITITDHQPATQRENNSADFRLINSSGNIVAQDYDHRGLFFRGYGASDSVIDLGGTSRDDLAILYSDTNAEGGSGNMVMYIYNPYANDKYTFVTQQGSGTMSYPSSTEKGYMQFGSGVYKSTDRITGFSVTNRDNYNISSGKYRVYGLKD